MTSLGWNETALISKAILRDQDGNKFGICSSVNSHSPDNVELNIHFIDGKNLDMIGSDCMFSGSELSVTSYSKPVSSSLDSMGKVHNATLGGQEFEFLHVAGITPKVEEDLRVACLDAFERLFSGPEMP